MHLMRISPAAFVTRKSVILLVLYILLSLSAMRINDPFALAGIRYALLQTAASVAEVKTKLRQWRSEARETERLKRELFRVRLENSQLKESLLENIRLKKLLKLKNNTKYSTIAAHVIGAGVEMGVESLLLDVGERQGVHKNMAVLCPEGLVGRIIAATPGQSIVQILMDPNSLVSVRAQKSRETGILSWKGNPWLNLLYVPKNIPVEKGELIVTSGLSRIYPPGIRVGIVSEIRKDKYNLFQQINVLPAVNFKALEDVFVVRYDESAVPEAANGKK